jgi:outer membrane protein OmpA-like peptidoglycan-associated protein
MKKLILKTILSIFLLLICNNTNAQNLVKNGSFENHGTIDFRERHEAQPNDWNTVHTLVCDCNYEEKVEIHTHGFNEHTCINPIGANDGCSMMKLNYVPRCKCHQGDNFSGCASYISSNLSKPLQVGKYYKITYWTYYSKKHNTLQDSSILDNLGFILTNKIIPYETSCLIKTRAIKSENFEMNKWFKTEKIIAPTCELNYLTIGIFRNNSWTSYEEGNYHRTYYFVDNVSVMEVEKTEITVENRVLYFCNTLKEPKSVLTKIDTKNYHIYFSTNEAVPLGFKKLEEMAAIAKAKPETVFLISGHADNVGTDNIELSKSRVEVTVNYLIQQHKIPKYRLITAHFGATKPIAPNDTEANKAKNRRVTIEATPILKSKALYRQALTELENGKEAEALRLFRGWEIHEKDSEKVLAYFDIKTDVLRQDKRWKMIDKAIKKSYDKYSNPEYAFILDSLYCEDQKYRRLNTYVQDLAGYLPIIDTSDWNYPSITNEELKRQDSLICLRLLPLLTKKGFPKISEVGKRAAKTAAVILIHSHDSVLLKQYLPIMEKHCNEGEADWGYFAMLYDKFCVVRNQPQRYGTQYLSNPKNPSEMILAKLENPSIINEKRKMIALLPLSLEVIEKSLVE